jgi:hypothetical protein
MDKLLDARLEVTHVLGTSTFHALACREARHGRVVVRITELEDNDGPSISLIFDLIARHVRQLLPRGEEPVWIEHWPGRSIAAFVLHDDLVASYHINLENDGSWIQRPIRCTGLDAWLDQ